VQDAAADLVASGRIPHLIILGTPPSTRGTVEPGSDGELQCIRAFPLATLLVEKPLSCRLPSMSEEVARALSQHDGPVGVGYMLRYLKGMFNEYYPSGFHG
jgi:predicted dehydrogenase